jgi:hypothetical protein
LGGSRVSAQVCGSGALRFVARGLARRSAAQEQLEGVHIDVKEGSRVVTATSKERTSGLQWTKFNGHPKTGELASAQQAQGSSLETAQSGGAGMLHTLDEAALMGHADQQYAGEC